MREEEKIKKGILFSPADPELVSMKLHTHNLCVDYNQKRRTILEKIIGSMGEHVFLQGPITFHYGIHTRIGNHFFGNFNLTIQDDAEVTIGDYCSFGPTLPL